MDHKKVLLVVPLIFALCGGGGAEVAEQRRRRQEPVDQIELAKQYFEADTKCRGLLKQEKWKEAEAACLAETRLADLFADQRELEKMGAYEQVGESLLGQKRYAEAITYTNSKRLVRKSSELRLQER